MTRVTRSSNSNSHPGMVDAPRVRRNKAQMTAAEQAKEAAKAAKEKAKKRKEEGVAGIEISMKEKEERIRELRVQHSRPGKAHLNATSSRSDDSASAAKSTRASTKRKRPDPGEEPVKQPSKAAKRSRDEETQESEADEPEPPTPAPPVLRSSSELSDFDAAEEDVPIDESATGPQSVASDEEDDNDTPTRPMKKAKKAPKVPLRVGVAAAKQRLATDDLESAAGTVRPGPSANLSTATSRPRVSAWASHAASAGLLTPTANKVQPLAHVAPRTAAVPATPFMHAPPGGDKSKARNDGKQGEKVVPRPRGRDKRVPAVESSEKVQVRDSGPAKVKREPVSDGGEIEQGGFAITDDESAEATAARNSPVKNGVRLTSTGIVKTEDVDLATPGKPKNSRARGKSKPAAPKQTSTKVIEIDSDDDRASTTTAATTKQRVPKSTVKNSDLPEGVHEHNLWRNRFLPTFLQAVGASADPWNLTDGQTVKLLQYAWDATYGDSSEALASYKVEVDDNVHAIATQRLYEWRSSFGSAAMRSYEAFFNSYPAEFSENESRVEFCEKILKGGRFLYEEPESDSKEGLYRSPFVLAAMAAHVDAIQGAVDLPELYTTREKAHPYAAIGLAGAAAFRAALVWYLGKVGIDEKGNTFMIKSLNRSTGKMSTKETDFSHTNFSEKTLQCMKSAKTLSSADIDQIVAGAYLMAQLPAPDTARVPPALAAPFDFDFGTLTQD